MIAYMMLKCNILNYWGADVEYLLDRERVPNGVTLPLSQEERMLLPN